MAAVTWEEWCVPDTQRHDAAPAVVRSILEAGAHVNFIADKAATALDAVIALKDMKTERILRTKGARTAAELVARSRRAGRK